MHGRSRGQDPDRKVDRFSVVMCVAAMLVTIAIVYWFVSASMRCSDRGGALVRDAWGLPTCVTTKGEP
jgi:hypothetical protein